MRSNHFSWNPLARSLLTLIGASMLLLGILVVPHSGLLTGTAYASTNSLHPFTITSPNFHDGGPLPVSSEFNRFGCHGDNRAPELDWTNVPSKTQGFAMLMTDVDAPLSGGFHHWIVYNIPANVRELEGNKPYSEGTNSYGFIGYGGPCPPPTGERHHYIFTLYALNIGHISGKGLTYHQVIVAMKGHVLAATSIVGTFKRPR